MPRGRLEVLIFDYNELKALVEDPNVKPKTRVNLNIQLKSLRARLEKFGKRYDIIKVTHLYQGMPFETYYSDITQEEAVYYHQHIYPQAKSIEAHLIPAGKPINRDAKNGY